MKLLLCLFLIFPSIIFGQLLIPTSLPLINITDKLDTDGLPTRKSIDGKEISVNTKPIFIYGRVIDGDTVIPLHYCTIFLIKGDSILQTTETSVIGTFFLGNIDPGNYTLKICNDNYYTVASTFDFSGKRIRAFRFDLYPTEYYDWTKLLLKNTISLEGCNSSTLMYSTPST